MTELKARVSGLKTFCTARYLRKSASRGFGWLSILKDVYSKQCRLLAHRDKSQSPENLRSVLMQSGHLWTSGLGRPAANDPISDIEWHSVFSILVPCLLSPLGKWTL
jgi:hypothetical protein